MQVIVSGKNVSITPSITYLVESKMDRLNKFWSRIIRIRVEVMMNRHHKHGNVFIVYARVETPGNDIRASSQGSDIHTALDLLYPKLERLVLRAKSKHSPRP